MVLRPILSTVKIEISTHIVPMVEKHAVSEKLVLAKKRAMAMMAHTIKQQGHDTSHTQASKDKDQEVGNSQNLMVVR